jgi:RNA polymerase sigma-32 factor
MKRKPSRPRAPSKSRKKLPTPLPVHDPEVMPREDEDSDSGQEVSQEESDEEPSDDLVGSHEVRVPATLDVSEREIAAISPHDPMRRYMDEVRRYPLLEPEEEFRLALELRDKGSMDAAKRLVQANLRLVVKIALEYRSFYTNLLDLVQEGNIGLMKAVSKFDPTKGARLGYYSSWWIRSYILKYLLDNFRLVKIGTTQAQKKLFYHLMREKERLEAQGLLAGPKLLADKLHVREKDVIEMEMRLSGRGAEMPLDAPMDSGGGDGRPATYLDFLADSSEAADVTVARNQLLQVLEDKLPEFREQLTEKELRILEDRILAEDPKTLQEVADHYGLTRERARQIEAKVIQKLREFLKPDLGLD